MAPQREDAHLSPATTVADDLDDQGVAAERWLSRETDHLGAEPPRRRPPGGIENIGAAVALIITGLQFSIRRPIAPAIHCRLCGGQQ